jgi:hypothetical protein
LALHSAFAESHSVTEPLYSGHGQLVNEVCAPENAVAIGPRSDHNSGEPGAWRYAGGTAELELDHPAPGTNSATHGLNRKGLAVEIAEDARDAKASTAAESPAEAGIGAVDVKLPAAALSPPDGRAPTGPPGTAADAAAATMAA